jgi:hypothetical protein
MAGRAGACHRDTEDIYRAISRARTPSPSVALDAFRVVRTIQIRRGESANEFVN